MPILGPILWFLVYVFFFLIFLYTVGIFLGVIFSFLKGIGKIRIHGRERLFGHSAGILLVSNHPSLLEVFLIPFLFFPQFLIRPFHFFPWGVGDPKVFINNWYYLWMRIVRFVSISKRETDPEDHAGRIRATFRKIKKNLENNQIVEFFPEGGRTCKRPKKIKSPEGLCLGELKRGFEELQKTFEKPYMIIPLWISGTDIVLPVGKVIPKFCESPIHIYIGTPIYLDPKERILTREELTQIFFDLAKSK